MNHSNLASKNRLLIPSIKVDAPISIKTVSPEGIMPGPDTPDDIACYDFSHFPKLGGVIGKEGNAIFSGHVDSGFQACKYGTVPPPCEAVLWNLDKLIIGDNVSIVYENKKYHYRVTSTKQVVLKKIGWGKVMAKTIDEKVTIITCGGEFNPTTNDYESRRIVEAGRIKV